MKARLVIGLALALAATPAHATQGLLCGPTSGDGPKLSLVIGAGGIAGASLDENGAWVSTMGEGTALHLTQAWIDDEQVLADIVDARWDRVARLRVRFGALVRGSPTMAAGTLTLRGRDWRVRCEES